MPPISRLCCAKATATHREATWTYLLPVGVRFWRTPPTVPVVSKAKASKAKSWICKQSTKFFAVFKPHNRHCGAKKAHGTTSPWSSDADALPVLWLNCDASIVNSAHRQMWVHIWILDRESWRPIYRPFKWLVAPTVTTVVTAESNVRHRKDRIRCENSMKHVNECHTGLPSNVLLKRGHSIIWKRHRSNHETVVAKRFVAKKMKEMLSLPYIRAS